MLNYLTNARVTLHNDQTLPIFVVLSVVVSFT